VTETITVNGKKIKTLKELLRTGLKAVFVGINPSLPSVKKGHYYQGKLGRRFWNRLRDYGITPALPLGNEDDVAFKKCDYGFADLVRRPTREAGDLSQDELENAVSDLERRLSKMRDFPIIVFVFQKARKFAGQHLEKKGHRVLKMPGPYAKAEDVKCVMEEIKKALKGGCSPGTSVVACKQFTMVHGQTSKGDRQAGATRDSVLK
jgi:TDG/mug DNA glycosylase family protein